INSVKEALKDRCRSRRTVEHIAQGRASEASPQPAASQPPLGVIREAIICDVSLSEAVRIAQTFVFGMSYPEGSHCCADPCRTSFEIALYEKLRRIGSTKGVILRRPHPGSRTARFGFLVNQLDHRSVRHFPTGRLSGWRANLLRANIPSACGGQV